MPTNVPILFLVFNRPEQTKMSLERIRLAQPRVLYVHCDGPRTDRVGETEKVQQVRDLISEGITWECQVHTLYRPSNLGLRAGVYDAIGWFFKQEAYGIILEDDCVPDLSFFPFCGELLEQYKDDAQVMHIGCSNLAEDFTQDLPESYVFSNFSFVWGWASWRRAWERMALDLPGLDDFQVKNMADVYMLDKFQQTRAGANNSWAYAWFYTILNYQGLCIVPKVNLVENTGVGAAGATHTTGKNTHAQRRARSINFPLVHPTVHIPDPALEKQFFYTSQKKRFRLLLWYILKKVGLR